MDLRAGSGDEEEEAESGLASAKAESGDEAAATSRPDVKARDPAPERIMHRMDGSEERCEKRGGRADHMGRMKALSLVGREISMSGDWGDWLGEWWMRSGGCGKDWQQGEDW